MLNGGFLAARPDDKLTFAGDDSCERTVFLRAGLGGLSPDIFGGIQGLWSTGCLESGLVPRSTRKVFVRMKFEAVA